MIAWAKLPNGRVFHGYDVKYPYARYYRSLCGKWQPYSKVDGPAELNGRRCKSCVTELKRHQKRWEGTNSAIYDSLKKASPDSSPHTNPRLRVRPNMVFCPEDGAIMVKRVPTENNNIDEPFWGCRNWPDCKYTRAILPDGRTEPEIYYLDDLRWIMEESG